MYALDAQTGALAWNKEYKTNDKIWAAPIVSNGTLLIASFDKNLYALNTADGSLKWKFTTQGAIINTPIVQNGVAYFGSFDRFFYAVDIQTGKQVWKTASPAGKWFWANPVTANDMIYAANLDGSVYVINPTNGQITATIKIGSGNAISSTPVLVGNSLYVADEKGNIFAINTGDNTAKLVINYQKTIYAPLTAKQNIVYVVTTDNNLRALNTESNLDLWGPVALQ